MHDVTMQPMPLSVPSILRHAESAHPGVRIVSRTVDGPLWRYDYAGLADRARRAAQMLQRLGVGPGDRVASLAWNTHRHLELFFAAPGIGAVLHTVNPRFSDDQIAYVINHGGCEILAFDATFLPLLARLAPRLPNVRVLIALSGPGATVGGIATIDYESLLAVEDGQLEWRMPEEQEGAVLCYTSGTTGDPKGVLYTHRSIVLHALAAGLSGAMGLSAFDVLMPVSSLYHACGWGLPYIAPINGCAMVLPGERFDAASLHELVSGYGVTFATGVPTIWTAYLGHLDQCGIGSIPIRRLLSGGSAVPEAMFAAFRRLGTDVLQMWGMTELSPVGLAATPTPALADATHGEVERTLWTRQGRRVFGVEVRIVDEAGDEVAADGETPGSLHVRGPWVIQRYYRAVADAVDAEGWFDTGDIATIDGLGYVRLTDRAKDVIKSGGEWISSIDLENEACACPGVRIAAAVGVPHPRWDERPVLIVERTDDGLTDEAVRDFLASRVVKWWLPDRILFDDIPLTATGKIDKKQLRTRYEDLYSDAG